MALINLTSNLANFRSEFTTTSIATQTPDPVGTFKLDNQLGEGSPFKYLKSGAIATKKFSKTGYHVKNKYTDNVDSRAKSLLSIRATEKNSPSALEAEYNKYRLRDESFNPSYIEHPLITRNIGQRWGFRSSPGAFDDGLIRGGMVTALDRSVQDTVRIAKWLASPKGLLWVVKQVGLGLTNPKVEAIGGAFTRQTRIHSGVASLLSVPTTAFGLHFTRHGIPFLNETASYEKVIKFKQLASPFDPYSRLINIKNEIFVKRSSTVNAISNAIQGIANSLGFKAPPVNQIKTAYKLFSGGVINEMSGLAGPNSVYGVGITNHRTYSDSTEAVDRAGKYGFITKYDWSKQYATAVVVNNLKSSNGFKYKGDKNTEENVDGFKDSLNSKGKALTKNTPGASKNSAAVELHSAEARNCTGYPAAEYTGIKSYATVAYNKIKKRSSAFQDFRNDIEDLSTEEHKNYVGKNTKFGADYFKQRNLEDYYGLGKLGEVGKDRSNPHEFIKPGSAFTKQNRTVLTSDAKFKGDKITALDIGNAQRGQVYGTGYQDLIEFYFEDGNQGTNVMPFRCTMTGFSDSFQPGWDNIAIMGRPDGAYLYTSFERSVSFSFIAAALTRSEMIPMWRKLNFLASYTMPDFSGNRPSGPFMRITIGNLFQQTPGFIESLSYSIPDDATWDIAEDESADSKQLPMMVEAQVGFKIVGDYRPQQMGRVYSISEGGRAGGNTNWLTGASVYS
jgi:hypothetical protein